MSNQFTQTHRLVGISVLGALVVVLQLLAGLITLGAFSITLVLVPIVVGAALFGPLAGAALGLAFGVVVIAQSLLGIDPGGAILMGSAPVITILVILARGLCAGAAAGFVYRFFAKRNIYAGVFSAAIICPLVNTGLLIAAMFLFFRYYLAAWAGGTSVLYFAFIGMAGINFLIELVVNIVLGPSIVRIVNVAKNRN